MLVLVAVTVVPLFLIVVVIRRERRHRARLDRHGLDDLRRIYRHDNPRGPGLEPLMRDQQPRIRPERKSKA